MKISKNINKIINKRSKVEKVNNQKKGKYPPIDGWQDI